MLAIAGVLFCDQIGSFPGFPSGKSQMDLFWQVFAEKPSAIGAGLFFIAVLEGTSSCLASTESTSFDGGQFVLTPC